MMPLSKNAYKGSRNSEHLTVIKDHIEEKECRPVSYIEIKEIKLFELDLLNPKVTNYLCLQDNRAKLSHNPAGKI